MHKYQYLTIKYMHDLRDSLHIMYKRNNKINIRLKFSSGFRREENFQTYKEPKLFPYLQLCTYEQ